MSPSPNVLQEIDTALNTAEKVIPEITPFLSLIPGANVIVPFLGLLPIAIQAVETIMNATGASQTGAITAVASHLTAGMPNAPALGANPPSASAQGGA
jgi:hypothetical protein